MLFNVLNLLLYKVVFRGGGGGGLSPIVFQANVFLVHYFFVAQPIINEHIKTLPDDVHGQLDFT